MSENKCKYEQSHLSWPPGESQDCVFCERDKLRQQLEAAEKELAAVKTLLAFVQAPFDRERELQEHNERLLALLVRWRYRSDLDDADVGLQLFQDTLDEIGDREQ